MSGHIWHFSIIFLWEMKQRNSVWAVCVQVLDEFSMKITQHKYVTQQIPFCCHFAICLSSVYTVQSYIWQRWVVRSLLTVKWSLLTVKYHMIVLMRFGRKRRWAVMMTVTADLDFQLQLDGHRACMWCKYFVYTCLSVKFVYTCISVNLLHFFVFS